MIIRGLRLLGILTFALAVATSSAWAQVQSGSILVKVVDESGGAMPGVTVTITSPVMPRPLVAVTDSGGVQRFSSLTIGSYAVTATLSGFKTVTRENIVVLQNETRTIDVTLQVGELSEVITVRAESPVVDSRSASMNTNLDAMLLDTTPGGKDIWSILEYKIPGLVFDNPDVGGNQAGLQRGFTSRGTPSSQNVQMVNGVNVGDPASIGASMNYYEPSTFENVQVTTGAQDISMATSGTLINMVTRAGTNRFSGRTLGTYQGKGTQWDNIDEPLKQAGFRPEAQAVGYISNANWQAGGPFIPDRLFYFGSINNQQTHVNVPGYPAISPPELPQQLSGNVRDSTAITSLSGKLTYALGGANRFEGYANRQWYDKPNRGANASLTLDSNTKEYDTFVISQLSWSSVLSSRLVADTKIAYSNTHFPLTQKTDLQTIQDLTTNVRHRNAASSGLMFRRRLQITSNWNYYIPELLGGRHELKFGFDNGYTPDDVTTTRVGNVTLTYRSQQGTASQPRGPVEVNVFNSPLDTKRAVMNTAFYGQDTFAIGRVTIIAGLRWERVEGLLPAQEHPSSEYFPEGMVIGGLNVALNTGGRLTEYTVRSTFPEVRNAPLWKNWAPRVSGTYDLFGTDKTVLKVSVGKYYDQIGTGTPGPNQNGAVSQTYAWNDLNGDLSFQRGNAVWDGTRYVGGEFGALSSTSIPNPNPFDPARRRSYRNEATVGIDHELFPSFRLSTAFIYRQERDTYGNVDGDISLWDEWFSPFTYVESGRDGLTGTADDQPLTLYTLNPGYTLVTDVPINDDRLGARYAGVEIVGTKRYGRGTTVLGGYTYSNERVERTSLANPNLALVNADGISGGRRHNFKVSGSALLPRRITLGANMVVASGRPITRTINVPGCTSTVTTSCLRQGTQNNVNAEPRGSVELAGRFQLDVRIGRIFNVAGQRFELGLDAYNLTNENTVYNVRTTSTRTNIRYANDPTRPVTQIPSFLSPTGILGPRILRLNVTYWFGARTGAGNR